MPTHQSLSGASDDDLLRRYDRLYVPGNDARYLRRNALVALGNAGDTEHADLAAAYADGEDAMLQEQARWTLDRLRRRDG